MNKKTKTFIYNFLSFALFFFSARYLVNQYTHLNGWWIPMTAFVISTILAPKFQAITTRDGEKIFMKWIFIKGVKTIE
ncbi:hypothetical protein HUE46_10810 [Flavobacterium columnare]|uniref:Uncharacterized protein n=2 Tax=Flavobacterium TaxID=237 RepID=A0AA94EZS7_9FLAO|nr:MULTISPECIES: hypothetical protein [Flavobacterium]OXA74601.1 hypothetical protein B0A56_12600 [Flavobacterium columnare NBRC 100251 = ATCC 23463]AMA48606.1 hypothetical protein AWN65_03580 [Flavobacterium covae]AND65266.1 hypothetical protein AX766_13175 [Flavobacterium covae]MBF6654358.1 hypothetical protein [Flavobacterium columnare]MCH4830551.1 hypothetical protein [Flavobacterium columnare]